MSVLPDPSILRAEKTASRGTAHAPPQAAVAESLPPPILKLQPVDSEPTASELAADDAVGKFVDQRRKEWICKAMFDDKTGPLIRSLLVKIIFDLKFQALALYNCWTYLWQAAAQASNTVTADGEKILFRTTFDWVVLFMPLLISILYFKQIYSDMRRDFALQEALSTGKAYAEVDQTAQRRVETPCSVGMPSNSPTFMSNDSFLGSDFTSPPNVNAMDTPPPAAALVHNESILNGGLESNSDQPNLGSDLTSPPKVGAIGTPPPAPVLLNNGSILNGGLDNRWDQPKLADAATSATVQTVKLGFLDFWNQPDDKSRRKFRAPFYEALVDVAIIVAASALMIYQIIHAPLGWTWQQMLNVALFGGMSLLPFGRRMWKKYAHAKEKNLDPRKRNRFEMILHNFPVWIFAGRDPFLPFGNLVLGATDSVNEMNAAPSASDVQPTPLYSPAPTGVPSWSAAKVVSAEAAVSTPASASPSLFQFSPTPQPLLQRHSEPLLGGTDPGTPSLFTFSTFGALTPPPVPSPLMPSAVELDASVHDGLQRRAAPGIAAASSPASSVLAANPAASHSLDAKDE